MIYFLLSNNFTKILEPLFWGIADLQILQVAPESVFEKYIQMGLEMVLLSIFQLEGICW